MKRKIKELFKDDNNREMEFESILKEPNMGKEKLENQQENPIPRKKSRFKNFAEYWHYVKPLSEEQRKVIAESLSKTEQKSLASSYKKGGWEDLFMRNQCDKILETIEEKFKVNMLLIRSKVLSGKEQLIQRSFWEYFKSCFEKAHWQHVAYILDGIAEEDFGDPLYIKLKKFNSEDFIEDEDEDDEDGFEGM